MHTPVWFIITKRNRKIHFTTVPALKWPISLLSMHRMSIFYRLCFVTLGVEWRTVLSPVKSFQILWTGILWYICRKSSIWYQYSMIFPLTVPCLLSTVFYMVIELTFYNYKNVLQIPGCLIVQKRFQSGHLVQTSLHANCKLRVCFVVVNRSKYCLLFRKNIRKGTKIWFL